MAKSKKTRVKVPGLDEAVAARNRLAEAIGSFAMNFVVLENQVNHAVGVFLRIPTIKMRQLLTAAIRNTSTRLDILQSLVNGCKMTKALRTDLSNCVKQIRESNTYRNRLLHDTWTGYQPHDRSWQKVRAITDSKFHYQSNTFSPKTVAAEDRKCIRLLVRLNKLTKRYDDYRQRQETLSASRKNLFSKLARIIKFAVEPPKNIHPPASNIAGVISISGLSRPTLVADPRLLDFNCPLYGSNNCKFVSIRRLNGSYFVTEFFQVQAPQ